MSASYRLTSNPTKSRKLNIQQFNVFYQKVAGLIAPLFIILFPAASGASTPANPTQVEFSIAYEFSRNDIAVGKVTRSLTKSKDNTYLFSSKSRTTGIFSWIFKDRISEQSVWKFNSSYPQPISYAYHQKGGQRKRKVTLIFDWNKNIVTNTINADPWQMKIPNHTLDKLLYQYALSLDLKNNKEQLIYPIADGGKLKTYEFKRTGVEQLKTPLGTMETVKLRRVSDKRGTIIWFAKNYHYLPVKITQKEKDGAILSMLVTNIDGIRKTQINH